MFLGHHSLAFTLSTYVHLLPDDLPEPDFAADVLTAFARVPMPSQEDLDLFAAGERAERVEPNGPTDAHGHMVDPSGPVRVPCPGRRLPEDEARSCEGDSQGSRMPTVSYGSS